MVGERFSRAGVRGTSARANCHPAGVGKPSVKREPTAAPPGDAKKRQFCSKIPRSRPADVVHQNEIPTRMWRIGPTRNCLSLTVSPATGLHKRVLIQVPNRVQSP